jgi:hypothetical protein
MKVRIGKKGDNRKQKRKRKRKRITGRKKGR